MLSNSFKGRFDDAFCVQRGSDKDLQGWKKVLVGMIIQVLNDMIFFFAFLTHCCVTLRSQQKHLALFQAKLPDKQLYDLSANPNKRRRVETKESALPCLTTSSTLWSHASTSFMFSGYGPC